MSDDSQTTRLSSFTEPADSESLRKRIAELEAELRRFKLETKDTKQQSVDVDMLMDLALHAMVLVDRTGRIIRVNSVAEKLFGYAPSELLGQSIELLVPDGAKESHPVHRNAYFENPSVRAMGVGRDLLAKRRDGTHFPVEIGLSPIDTEGGAMVLSSILDISERKREELKFRLAVESSPSAMVMSDDAGLIVLVNLQTERVFGYSRHELIGQPIEILIPDRFRSAHPGFRKQFLQRPAIRPMGVGRDLRGRRRDGSEFPVEIGLTPIESGEELFVLSAIVDITERVEAESKRRLHLSELAHANRLSAVGEMFSRLAHELNQPLAAAANYARACVLRIRSNEPYALAELEEWMELAADQAIRATDIVKTIGAYARRGDGGREPIDINEIVRSVVAIPIFTASSSEELPGTQLALDLADNLPDVHAERIQLEQVLLNLVRNAIDAMMDTPISNRRLSISTRKIERAVEVVVADSGIGMSPSQIDQLFIPFYTTKTSGMGLGLSVSKSIIEAHSGTISVESRVGEGSKFRLTIPSMGAEEKACAMNR